MRLAAERQLSAPSCRSGALDPAQTSGSRYRADRSGVSDQQSSSATVTWPVGYWASLLFAVLFGTYCLGVAVHDASDRKIAGALVEVGFALAAWLLWWRVGRVRVIADATTVTIVNPIRRYVIPREEVASIGTGTSGTWVWLTTTNGRRYVISACSAGLRSKLAARTAHSAAVLGVPIG